MWLVGFIANILIYPVQALVVTAFPSIGWVFTEITTFCTEKLFPMISFIRDIFLGITCCPTSLWDIFIGILIFRLGVVPVIRTVKVVINVWKIKNGNVN